MANELTIPEYTAEDFDGDAPYQWLYERRNNKFLLNQLLQKMKKQAGALGVKGFVTMFNAYCETMASETKETVGRATRFEGQPLELMAGGYICTESGVSTLDKFGYEIAVCRHPIMPIQRLVNADSGEERVELWYKKGYTTRTIVVEKSVTASSAAILQLAAYGIMVNSENAKLLCTYLQDIEQLNYNDIPEQKSIGRLGWIGEQFSPYVEDLAFDGETNFRHIFGAVQSSGSRDKWLNAMRKVRAERSPGRLFLAASFASVILEPCGLLPFFLHAWGGTETGKTVGLMIAASVWASPKMGNYVTTFNSTNVGMEMTASFLNSLPMCVDELQIQSSAGVKDFDKLIYQLTEGVGRTRGAKTGGLQKQNTWKNCIITNGEHPITNAASGGGAVNRIIEFECAEKVYSDLVGLCAVINENYGFAGREFVEYLQTDGAKERINTMQKDFYRELLKTDGTDKQAASASAILAADAIATELFFKDDHALTIQEMAEVMTKRSDVDANARALDYIYELVGRNPLHFVADDNGVYKAEVWGKLTDTKIYIIKSVFDREMLVAGFNSSSFLSWARRRSLLNVDRDESRNTKTAKIAGSTIKTVCILRNNNQFVEMDEDECGNNDQLPF